MKIKDLNTQEILNKKNINSKFLSVFNDKLQLDCKVLKSNFFLDSFNFFPITEDNNSFRDLFSWGDHSKYENFYTTNFNKNFNERKKNLKKFSNAIILGSSTTDNYYRNMLTFFPRIFFINEKEINIAIHRNSSNKWRIFISKILEQLKIKINKYVYLDDDFYIFKNSQIPQFFDESVSIKILKKCLLIEQKEKKLNVYVSRQNSQSRNLINEEDIIDEMKSKNFMIIDTKNMSVFEQIDIFSSAKIIIGPTGSALTNIIFCLEGTKIIEIVPKYNFGYEQSFKNRYSRICNILNLNYKFIEADPVENVKLNSNTEIEKFISKKVLKESNYYKDLLIKKNKFKNLIKSY